MATLTGGCLNSDPGLEHMERRLASYVEEHLLA